MATKYKEFKLTLFELLNMYEQNDFHSFLRQELGGLIVNYISYLENEGYADYCKFIDKKLKEKHLSLYQDITTESLLQGRKEEALLRKMRNNPDIILVEANLCFDKIVHSNNKKETTAALDKLYDLYTQSCVYYGENSYIASYLGLNHSLYCIRNGQMAPEYTEEMQREVATLHELASEDYESVLNILSGVFGTFVNVSPDVAAGIYREIETVAEKIRPNDEYGYFTALCNKLYLQRISVRIRSSSRRNETSFE